MLRRTAEQILFFIMSLNLIKSPKRLLKIFKGINKFYLITFSEAYAPGPGFIVLSEGTLYLNQPPPTRLKGQIYIIGIKWSIGFTKIIKIAFNNMKI